MLLFTDAKRSNDLNLYHCFNILSHDVPKTSVCVIVSIFCYMNIPYLALYQFLSHGCYSVTNINQSHAWMFHCDKCGSKYYLFIQSQGSFLFCFSNFNTKTFVYTIVSSGVSSFGIIMKIFGVGGS